MMKTARIVNALKKYNSFLISTHVNPDPDALSSELALAFFLKSKGKKVFVVNEEKVPNRYAFMPGIKMIRRYKRGMKINYDAAIVVDCGELDRIGRVQDLLNDKTVVINIDHHITNLKFGDVNLVKPDASSTAEILFDVLKDAKCKITKNIAINLYVGIMTDTGSFRYENTTANTHAIVSQLLKVHFSVSELYKKLYESVPMKDLKNFTTIVNTFTPLYGGKVIGVVLRKKTLMRFTPNVDLRDKIFRFLRTIQGVEALAIFTEHNRHETRVNLRSQGRVNVAKVAHHFSGGGHKRASGCVLNSNIAEAQKKVFAQIRKML